MVTASIDFGTTNSVIGVNNNSKIKMIPLGKNTLETKSVIFYSFEDKNFYVGEEALKELESDTMGRYLVSLKSFLGAQEEIETKIGKDFFSLPQLIAIMLRRFKVKIEENLKQEVTKVVLGRPVRFNDTSDKIDKLAENRLREAALIAGFKDIYFQYEPIAAALSYEDKINKEELILVADIGGGTTDYTIIKVGGELANKQDRKDDILATNGVYIGGNNFDTQIINNYIVEHLGKGSKYRNMGKDMYIGSELYTDFSQWHKFQKMYDPQVIHSIEKYIQMSYNKTKIKRLLELIKERLYFAFSQKIINSKIELSSKDKSVIDMNIFEDPFRVILSRKDFNNSILQDIRKIESTLYDTLKMANLNSKDIDKVFLTGGSTYVPAVKNIYKNIFGVDKLVHTDVLSSVGYGLALYAGRIK